MTIYNVDFNKQIGEWASKTEQRILAVFRESTKMTVRKAQSRIPVDTGFARASIRSSLSMMPTFKNDRPDRKVKYPYNEDEIILTIANAKIGETIYVGWTANYVAELELGSSQQAPHGFVGLAVLEWDRTVFDVVARLKQQNDIANE